MSNFDPNSVTGLVGLWDFIGSDKKSGTANDDTGLDDGIAQDGEFIGGASASNGAAHFDGKCDRFDVKGDWGGGNDDAFDLASGTLEVQFTQDKHIGSSPDTLVSRGEACDWKHEGYFTVAIKEDGSIFAMHCMPGGLDTSLATSAGFAHPGDTVNVKYCWDEATGATLVAENLSTGETETLSHDIAGLSMEIGDNDDEHFTFGAREYDDGCYDHYFKGSIDHVAIYDNAGAAPDGVVDGEAAGEFMGLGYDDANAPTDQGGDMITNDADTIYGNGGNDTIEGAGGGDLIYGDSGDLAEFGAPGDDTVRGGDGEDTIYGEAGSDLLEGGNQNDVIYGDGIGTATPVGANLVLNGSFEANNQPDGTFSQGPMAGWENLGENIEVWGDGFGGVNAVEGQNFVEIDVERSQDQLRQDIATTDGEQYQLSFSAQQRVDGSDDELEVWFGDQLIDTITPTDDWSVYTYTVTGSGQDMLKFREPAADNNSVGPLIDDVSLRVLAVTDADDTLMGQDGDDVMFGQEGNDVLIGGDGGDAMDGGADDDTFVLNTREEAYGDVIDGGTDGTDYDTLDLRNLGRFDIINETVDADGDSTSGTVNFLDADGTVEGQLVFSEIENLIPCFTPGTRIATPRGEVAVEDLSIGDRIITRDDGVQAIEWIGKKYVTTQEMLAQPKLKPVLIKKGALGNNLPERDMWVSPNHRMLLANENTQMLFDEREVLVAAKHLVGQPGIMKVDTMGIEYIHVMFKRHQVILGDGSWTESFQPGDQTLGGFDEDQRDEIFTLFPDLAKVEGRRDYAAARHSLKAHEAVAAREALLTA